jgi:hypothetical protein
METKMKFFSLILALLIASTAIADRRHAPFHPHDDKRFDEIEDQLESTTAAANLARKQARFVYDVAVDGGSSTADKGLGVDLPAGAVLTKVILYINTAFTDSGTGSLALKCSGNQDILGWSDITDLAINSMVIANYEDSQTNAPAGGLMFPEVASLTAVTTALNSITTACEVTADVSGDAGYVPLTAGKLTGIIEYFNKD